MCERAAATTLGWTQASWDGGQDPPTASQHVLELKKEQEKAVYTLGYMTVEWDEYAERLAEEAADDGGRAVVATRLLPNPIIHACRDGNQEDVGIWLDGGGGIDWMGEKGRRTLLNIAAYHGHEPIVEMLLQRKAAVDLQNRDGGTALIAAARNGHIAVAHRLLAAGAKTEVRARVGKTALQIANRSGHAECAVVIAEHAVAGMPMARRVGIWNGGGKNLTYCVLSEERDGRVAQHTQGG